MRLIKSPVFIICVVLFIMHQAAQKIFNVELGVVDSYLDNLLAMPIILTLLLLERIYLFKWKDYNKLTVTEIIIATAFIAFMSEVVFPAFSDKFTGDWLDVIFFFLGALIYYLSINKSYKIRQEGKM